MKAIKVTITKSWIIPDVIDFNHHQKMLLSDNPPVWVKLAQEERERQLSYDLIKELDLNYEFKIPNNDFKPIVKIETLNITE
jgi:hypothetical protein